MALRTIVLEGDSCLTKVCRPVTAFNGRLHQLLDDMAETLADANGAGLAAPQVGILRRVCLVLDEANECYLELVNPEIIKTEGKQSGLEGCLSVPGSSPWWSGPTSSGSGLRTGPATGLRRRPRASPPGPSATRSSTWTATSSWSMWTTS